MSSLTPFLGANDLTALKGIVQMHNISDADFDIYVKSYFPGGMPPGKTFHAADIQGMIDNADCSMHKFHIEGDDKMSNDDITFRQVDYTEQLHPCYSAALLKGALLVHVPETFEFSKAVVRGVNSVIFRAFDKSGNCLYNADLTEAWP